jgi:predicted lipid-binding transport protein (Tim44 family)
MRYSLNDTLVDRASGRVVQIEPSEATELWTFRRTSGGHWLLSAIQQT